MATDGLFDRRLRREALFDPTCFNVAIFDPEFVGNKIAKSVLGKILNATSEEGPGNFRGTVTREGRKLLAGGLNLVGSGGRRAGKPVSGTVSSVGSQARLSNRLVAGLVSFAGSFAWHHFFVLLCEGLLSFNGALARISGKLIAGVLLFTGAQSRRVAHAVTATVSFVGAISYVRIYRMLCSGVVNFIGMFFWLPHKRLDGVLAPAGAISRYTTKRFAGLLGLLGNIVRRTRTGIAGHFGDTRFLVGRVLLPIFNYTGQSYDALASGDVALLPVGDTIHGDTYLAIGRIVGAVVDYGSQNFDGLTDGSITSVTGATSAGDTSFSPGRII